jgi:hypothetical protein
MAIGVGIESLGILAPGNEMIRSQRFARSIGVKNWLKQGSQKFRAFHGEVMVVTV